MSAPGHVDAGWLAGRLTADNARELGRGLTRLIDGGELTPGTQLPTIRDFARAAGVSPGTVMAAWSRVRDTGRLETRRRGGTVVAGTAPAIRDHKGFEWSQIEMSLVTPDPTVQPDLRSAIVTALGTRDLHAAQRAYITPELLRAVQPGWPFPAQAWNCVGGGSEALVLASAAAVGGAETDTSRLIAVEEPVSPGYLDILRHLGIRALGVRADAEGPMLDSAAEALRAGASALVLQPSGTYTVTGGLTAARAEDLAELVSAHPGVWVIEDDSAGPLAASEPVTLGTALPDRVVRIRSYCKAFGIDLRSAVLGGSGELVERTIRLRSFGMASNSRVLQNSLADLIEDDAVADQMARARAVYGRRRQTALRAFAAVGLSATSGHNGFVVWIPVPDETSALINLARQGIVVAAGAKSFLSAHTGLLRVSILQLPDDDELIGDLARAVRAAIHSADREYFD
ncbi:MAG: aminotransferase class I/II-fold pyridoxal phosphate-dependent enzyme [Mycolicibacterium neoaurum]|uniref:aminotransferase class I/II-fold pyridoxal phosphate-dependent enzyme n=1 Tax=Mycolicibacterium neoaurum TaxID=1795 RepID=UPI002FF65142